MDSNQDAALCPVCYAVYDDPRILPCGHSFCLNCISRVADVTRIFLCPSCRTNVKLGDKGVNGLPKNYGLGNIIEGHKKMSSALCSDHKKALDMFCKQCDMMICPKCFFNSHSEHTVQDIEAVFNTRKERLTELLESTKPWQAQIIKETDEIRSSQQSVQKNVEAIKTKIDDKFRRWFDDLEKQRQTLQRYIDEGNQQRIKVFDNHLAVLESANTEINNLQTEINTIFSKDTTSLVQLCGSVEESHKTVKMKAKKVMEISFAPPPNLEIDISAPWIEEAIQNIKLFDTGQGQTTSAGACKISKILDENETLQKNIQELKEVTELYDYAMKNTERREKETSGDLEDVRNKNKELIHKLEKEKQSHELKNADIRRRADELMENIIQTSLDQFEEFKKHLDDRDNYSLSDIEMVHIKDKHYGANDVHGDVKALDKDSTVGNIHSPGPVAQRRIPKEKMPYKNYLPKTAYYRYSETALPGGLKEKPDGEYCFKRLFSIQGSRQNETHHEKSFLYVFDYILKVIIVVIVVIVVIVIMKTTCKRIHSELL